MIEKSITISAPNGLHARPAGELVRLAKSLAPTRITLSAGAKSVNASSMLSVLSLGLKSGTSVTIKAEGGDESEAVRSISDFILSIKD